MGYYAQVEIDFTIKAGHIDAARKSLMAAKAFSDVDNNTDLSEYLRNIWHDGDVYAEWSEATPLAQLAGAATDTDTRSLYVHGYAHVKWRDWVDGLLRVLAPHLTEGSSLEIRGEEYERVRYDIAGGEFRSTSAVEVWDDEFKVLTNKALAFDRIAALFESGASLEAAQGLDSVVMGHVAALIDEVV